MINYTSIFNITNSSINKDDKVTQTEILDMFTLFVLYGISIVLACIFVIKLAAKVEECIINDISLMNDIYNIDDTHNSNNIEIVNI